MSYVYRWSWALTINLITAFRCISGKGPDLEFAILFGEKGLKILNQKPIDSLLFLFKKRLEDQVKLYDLTFGSPITFSSFQGDLNQLDM